MGISQILSGIFGKVRVEAFHRFFPGAALRRALARDKERELEMRVLPLLVDADAIAIDVGANVGLYTGDLLQLARKVIALEPHPRLARVLGAFPADKVTVVRAIASDVAGQTLDLEVQISNFREMDALAAVVEGPSSGRTRRYRTVTTTLDDIGKERVGFIKIDVEGHELKVLEGARGLLARDHPILLVEAEKRHRAGAPEDIFGFLVDRGYTGFFLSEGRARLAQEFDPAMQDEALLEGYERRELSSYVNNFIFIPPDRDCAAIMQACDERLASMSRTRSDQPSM